MLEMRVIPILFCSRAATEFMPPPMRYQNFGSIAMLRRIAVSIRGSCGWDAAMIDTYFDTARPGHCSRLRFAIRVSSVPRGRQ